MKFSSILRDATKVILAGGLVGVMLFAGHGLTVKAATDVPIDESNFPDRYFREYVKKNCDENKDGKLSEEEINKVTSIYIYSNYKPIKSVTGIEKFTKLKTLDLEEIDIKELKINNLTNLTSLRCSGTNISSLDVTNLTKLESLDCDANQLTKLEIGKLPDLMYLICKLNKLTSLSVESLPKIIEMDCSYNELTELDVSKVAWLEKLDCEGNSKLKVLKLVDLPDLRTLSCDSCNLSSLDVSRETKIERLFCNNNDLSSLDIHNLNNLENLTCKENKLTQLDVNGLENITRIDCSSNNLTTLDLSGLKNLTELSCGYNELNKLELGKNSNLEWLSCNANNLSVLDISNLVNLLELDCRWNVLTNLNLSNAKKLSWIECYGNNIAKLDIRGLYDLEVDNVYADDETEIIYQEEISKTTISSIADQIYTGKAIQPKFTVKYGSKTLENGTDYSISYSNNTKIGTATVTINGKGRYTGTKKVTFKIVAVPISKTSVASIKNQTYARKAIKPSVTVKYGTSTLKNGTDYTVSYSNNTNVGIATVVITGKGNYAGTKKVTFKITAVSITKAKFSSVKSYTYTGKQIKPGVTVTFANAKLKNGKDYSISYGKNKSTGQGTIAIKGKGNFSGTKNITFYIIPKTVSQSNPKSSKRGTATVKWGKVTDVSGYEVAYATSKNGKYKVGPRTNKTTATINKLTSRKTYYIKVRAYKMVGKNRVYGNYSSIKSVKVK